ncbi:hypothetical protein KJ596_00040 [Patescibacteria group bacterium]|nr:hypothetical protein [Patescibacteria group bacterium]MBU1867841.1 hypothetical protein [Patescibacteria group bacterium]
MDDHFDRMISAGGPLQLLVVEQPVLAKALSALAVALAWDEDKAIDALLHVGIDTSLVTILWDVITRDGSYVVDPQRVFPRIRRHRLASYYHDFFFARAQRGEAGFDFVELCRYLMTTWQVEHAWAELEELQGRHSHACRTALMNIIHYTLYVDGDLALQLIEQLAAQASQALADSCDADYARGIWHRLVQIFECERILEHNPSLLPILDRLKALKYGVSFVETVRLREE